MSPVILDNEKIMKLIKYSRILACLAFVGLSMQASLAGATTLHLSKDCAAAGLANNCYETVDEIQERLWGVISSVEFPFGSLLTATAETINPGPANPVTVSVGPGRFYGQFSCSLLKTGSITDSNLGYVSIVGAGRDLTFLEHHYIPFNSIGCGNLEFRDLTIRNTGSGELAAATYFTGWGLGNTRWDNVRLESLNGIPWYEVTTFTTGSPDCKDYVPQEVADSPLQEHYFFRTEMIGAKLVYIGACSQTWIYDSELVLKTNPNTDFVNGEGNNITAILSYADGDVRLFGSSVRVDTSAGVPAGTETISGVKIGTTARNSGIFHMHSGVIDVDTRGLLATGETVDAIGILNTTSAAGSFAHTLGTPIFVSSDPGQKSERLTGIGKIMSPQLWQPGTEPPQADSATGDFSSLDGQDIYVETDCDSSGCTGGNEPHLMAYSEACGLTGSPWFDMVNGVCR